MQCFANQTAELDPSKTNCPAGGICFINWNNETGVIQVNDQGCDLEGKYKYIDCSRSMFCALITPSNSSIDCPSRLVRPSVYTCCCTLKEDEGPCNYLNIAQPYFLPNPESKFIAPSTEFQKEIEDTSVNKISILETSAQVAYYKDVSTTNPFATKEDYNGGITVYSLSPYIHLALPLCGIILCIVIIIYLWQKKLYSAELEDRVDLERQIQHRRRRQGRKRNECKTKRYGCFRPKSTEIKINAKRYSKCNELKNADCVKLLTLKGRGHFGMVWEGELHGKNVAVKIFNISEKESYENELAFYTLPFVLTHENILRFIGINRPRQDVKGNTASIDSGSTYLVLEFHNRGSLKDYLNNATLNWNEMLKITEGIASGLLFLHESVTVRGQGYEVGYTKPTVVHRDLKSNNILLKEDLTCCISDFGLAHIFTDYGSCVLAESFAQVGTKQYMAPELLDTTTGMTPEAFTNADMYACGIVLWELLSRCQLSYDEVEPYKYPYENELGRNPSMESIHNFVVIQKMRPKIKPFWNSYVDVDSFVEIMTECWDQDPDARISAGCVEVRVQNLTQFPAEFQDLNSFAYLATSSPTCIPASRKTPTTSSIQLAPNLSSEKKEIGITTCMSHCITPILEENTCNICNSESEVLSDIDSPSLNVSLYSSKETDNAMFIYDKKFFNKDDEKASICSEKFDNISPLQSTVNSISPISEKRIRMLLHRCIDQNNNKALSPIGRKARKFSVNESAIVHNKETKNQRSSSDSENSINALLLSNKFSSDTQMKNLQNIQYHHCHNNSRYSSRRNSSGRGSLDLHYFPKELHLDEEEIEEMVNYDLEDNVWEDETDVVSGYGSYSIHEGKTHYGISKNMLENKWHPHSDTSSCDSAIQSHLPWDSCSKNTESNLMKIKLEGVNVNETVHVENS